MGTALPGELHTIIVLGKDSAEPIPQMSLPTINREGKHIFSKNLWRLRKVEDSFICINSFVIKFL